MTYMMNRNTNSDLNDFFDGFFNNWNIRSSYPAVNVYEDADSYYLEAELPGYTADDVDISVDKHVLSISSNKTSKENDRKFVLHERREVKFERSFSLPEHVNESAINAEFKNGVLTIALPKVAAVQPRRIDVKVNA